jgi:hypothetical protein
MNGGIEQEGMVPAVPSHIDEPNEVTILAGGEVDQASSQNRLEIARLVIGPRRREERVQSSFVIEPLATISGSAI